MGKGPSEIETGEAHPNQRRGFGRIRWFRECGRSFFQTEVAQLDRPLWPGCKNLLNFLIHVNLLWYIDKLTNAASRMGGSTPCFRPLSRRSPRIVSTSTDAPFLRSRYIEEVMREPPVVKSTLCFSRKELACPYPDALAMPEHSWSTAFIAAIYRCCVRLPLPVER